MDKEIVTIGHYTCEVMHNNGQWYGKCVVPTPKGNITICARASEAAIANALARRGGAEVGRWGFFKKIKRFARRKVLRGITHGLSKIVNNPLMRKAMSVAKFIPGYGPLISKAYKTARRVTNIADGLARGNRRSRTAVRSIRRMAQRHMNPRQRRRARAVLGQLRSTYAMRYGISPRTRGRVSGEVMHLRGWKRSDLGPISIVGAERGARDLWGALEIGVTAEPSRAKLDYVRGLEVLTSQPSASSGY